MKKRIILILSIPLILFALAFTFEPANSFPLFGKFIILDPGHGADDPGSVYKDEYEKDYNLEFAKSLRVVLENYGATVIMTRTGDYDLSNESHWSRKRSDFKNRIKLINEDKPDIYLSLHMNYLNDSKYYGSQVFYSQINTHNERIAEVLQTQLNDYFSFDKSYNKIGTDKYMFGRIEVPGVLIEYGFMSSARDRANLKKEDYRRELSTVIADGLVKYFT